MIEFKLEIEDDLYQALKELYKHDPSNVPIVLTKEDYDEFIERGRR
jgi:hypothetical protein